MTKMQEAFEIEFGLRDNGEKYWQESSAFFNSWCDFQAGYQAAIAAIREGGSYHIIGPDFAAGTPIKLYKLPDDTS